MEINTVNRVKKQMKKKTGENADAYITDRG